MGRMTPQTEERLIGHERAECRAIAAPNRGQRQRAFSLIELLVVLAVATVLIGLMLPGLSVLRESARRVGCASNMHQIAIGLNGFATDANDRLPNSYFAGNQRRSPQPELMMIVHRGRTRDGWDGIGRLYIRRYLSSSGVYYCPSYSGRHSFDRYEDRWTRSNNRLVFSNYHYRGIFDFSLTRPDPIDGHLFHDFRLERPIGLALLADGLRTKSDFSHIDGTNLLRDDLSVRWFRSPRIYSALPSSANEPWPRDSIWGQIDRGMNQQNQSNR